MVNLGLCETARPQFQKSRPRLETKSRIGDSKSPETRLGVPSETGIRRFRDRALRDPHFWKSHSIPLKAGFIVLDCLRQIAHNISFIDNFKHKITLEEHSETLLSTTERRAVSPID